MRVHTITLSIVDFDNLSKDRLRDVIESTQYPNRCIDPIVTDIKTQVMKWDKKCLTNSLLPKKIKNI